MQNRPIYSGGRIYFYQVAHALCELGYDVTIYTNMHPPWEDDLQWNKGYKTIIMNAEDLEDVQVDASIYMGLGKEGGIACARNGVRTGKPTYCFVTDPAPMTEKYDPDRLEGEKGCYFEVDNLIRGEENVTVVLLTEIAKEMCEDYFPNKKVILQPCVNDKVADKYKDERENIVVASATTGERDKGFERALKVFQFAPDDWKFHIFTSSQGSRIEKWITQYGLEGRVIPHFDKDDEEKYEVFSRAKVMFCPSHYEGYGMWLAEGRYMGLECVVVDSGAIREVAGEDKHIHIAERNNNLDLIVKLNDAVKVDRFYSRKKEFTFKQLVSNLKKILE